MLRKSALLEIIAGKNRGLLATASDKQAILSAIAQLEDYNPTPRPVEAPELLNGDWRLLYTTSRELLNLDSFPLVKLGQIYQSIRVKESKIYNIGELYGLPYLEGIVSVAARFEPTSERRVQVKFERSIVGLSRLIGYEYPGKFIDEIESGKKFAAVDFGLDTREQQGWLDVTYLDKDLRIGRGNKDSVFVLTKE
ncbi:PAP/fibrillin family protein [Microcoleus sp. MON2_D6]|uniref:PAP/fibrillin family protein n=1 Tax=unclassified Microcoleus TaxID=2642155 RepID=UPI002FCEDDE2